MTTESKGRMLAALEDFRKKVEIGEITSLVMVADCGDGFVLSRRLGSSPSPVSILILQDIAAEARDIFIDSNNGPDDGRPRLREVEDEEE